MQRESPKQNAEVRDIKGVSVHENTVDSHNVFSVDILNNFSGLHKYVEIYLTIISVQMMVDS